MNDDTGRPEPDVDHYPDLKQGVYAVAPIERGRAVWPVLGASERALLFKLRATEAELEKAVAERDRLRDLLNDWITDLMRKEAA